MAKGKKSATNAATSKEPTPAQKSQDDLRAIKASCCRTKNISDEDFSKLSRDKQKFLLAQWDRPETLKSVGGSRAMRPNSQIPPPSVFAGSSEYCKNLKSLAQWWELSIQHQDERICEYDALSHADRITFHFNIGKMLQEQDELYRKLHGIEEPVHFDHGNDHDDDSSDEEEEYTSNNSRTRRSASIGSINDRPLSFRRIISPVPRPAETQRSSPSDQHPPNLPHLGESDDDGDISSAEMALSSATKHPDGLFASSSSIAGESDATAKTKKSKHLAASLVRDKYKTLLDALVTFFDITPIGDKEHDVMNDVVLVNIRNLYYTKTLHDKGSKRMYRLPHNEVKVSIFGRTEAHANGLMGELMKSLASRKCPDRFLIAEKYNIQFVCGAGPFSFKMEVGKHISQIDEERKQQRVG